jgi:DNA-binding GntR family transcriptional regulator
VSRADEAYALLRRRITRCDLAPGAVLTAGDLAEDLGLGLTPVREALTQLHRERLVVTMPRRGYRVAPVTAAHVRSCLDVWVALRPRVVALAVTHASPEAAARISALLDGGPAPAAGTSTSPAALEDRTRAWSLMAASTGNRLLEDVCRLLDAHLLRALTILAQASVPAGPVTPAGPTVRWADAFATRDAVAAAHRAATEAHAFRAAVLPHLSDLPRPDDAGSTPQPPGGPPPARSLADDAWHTLRRRIVRGDLAPGARLSGRVLAADLGTGITPVREALARLDHERLVVTLPRTGYAVTVTTPQDVRDTLQVWAFVVPPLVALAVQHATDEQARRIVRLMTGHGQGTDPATVTEDRSLGWWLLAEAGGNTVLEDVVTLVDGVLSRLFARLVGRPGSPVTASPLDWERLFAERDPALAQQQTDRYLAVLDTVTHWAVGQVDGAP